MMRLLLVTLLFISSTANAQLSADTVLAINRALSSYNDTVPGVQVVIGRGGKVIYSTAKGIANLEYNIPVTAVTKFEIGSVSKQFTAAAILLLEQQKKLSLNDDVRKFFKDMPDYGHKITLRQLMYHMGGLRDWGSIAEITGWSRTTKAFTNEDARQIIVRQKAVNFKPGDEYIYGNSGYLLMAMIVEWVSKMTLQEFCKKYIFEPAGMKNTEWRDNFRKVVKNRSTAYRFSNGSYIADMPFESTYGHAGLITTAEDLYIWTTFFTSGKLGGADLLRRQLETGKLNNGYDDQYAAGIDMHPLNGRTAYSHGGASASYRGNLEYFPELDLSIITLSNNATAFQNLPAALRNIFVSRGQFGKPAPQPVNISAKTFQKFSGVYASPKTGAGLTVIVNDTSIIAEPGGKLVPTSFNTAADRGSHYFFSQYPALVHVIGSLNDTTTYYPAKPADLANNAADYIGWYSSEEADAKIQVIVKDGKLFYRNRYWDNPLTPSYKDGFNITNGSMLFERDTTGKVVKLFITMERARKVEFLRMP